MKEELSVARVIKALEQKISENPSRELVESYLGLLDRLNAPEPLGPNAEWASKFDDLDKRVQFLESLSKVRVMKDGTLIQ